VIVEALQPRDWPAVRRILAEGIATGIATLDTRAPDWDTWDRTHLPDLRLVVRNGEQVLAWAACRSVSPRDVYGGVAEVSIYVSAADRDRGVGRALLTRLVEDSERAGFWTLQAGIFPENAASIALHRACGFREVGRRERIGKRGDRWRDVILMERRSRVVGV
jgi:phosphinothricin acetyltransferase